MRKLYDWDTWLTPGTAFVARRGVHFFGRLDTFLARARNEASARRLIFRSTVSEDSNTVTIWTRERYEPPTYSPATFDLFSESVN